MYGFQWIPVDDYVITLYAVFLARTFRSPHSVSNYISGVRTVMVLLDLPISAFESPSLKLTLKGVSRIKQHKPKRAAPITPDILYRMSSVLDLTIEFNVVTWALFLIAFFTMSRKSNLVYTVGQKLNHHVKRRDIKVKNDVLFIRFRSSKTNQDGSKHHIVPVPSITGSVLCPVNAYKNMCNRVKVPNENCPAFSYHSARDKLIPFSYKDYMFSLKALCVQVGLKSEKYSSHSFRRGGASWAFRKCVPGELLKVHGDWKSDAYQVYLDFSLEQKMLVGLMMADSL